MRKRKSAAVVSQFFQRQYGIGWREISSKLRSTLLEEVEHVSCNLCGSDESSTVATRDKYKLPLKTVICRQCGLLYLNPRPTAAIYRKFYEQGGQSDSIYHRRIDFDAAEDLLKYYYGPDFVMTDEARAAMAKFKEEQAISSPPAAATDRKPAEEETSEASDVDAPLDDDDDVAPEQAQALAKDLNLNRDKLDYYGKHLYDELKDFVPVGGAVFEPGASWGKMLQPWKELHGSKVSGVEPKKEAVRVAKENFGIDLIQGFADDPRIPENTYDLVINTRTVNHMLDPLGDFRNAWRWLKPGGILFVDIQDATKEARFEGFELNVVEIDHPYMFSLNTLSAMVQKAGFIIEKKEVTNLQRLRDWDDRPPQDKQIRIVARKSMEPIDVEWPDPMTELADLMLAQLTFDREQNDLLERDRVKGRRDREKYARIRSKYDELKKKVPSESDASAGRLSHLLKFVRG